MAAKNPKILLAEDDPNDVLLFQRALQQLLPQAELIVASDGDEVLLLLGGEGPAGMQALEPPPSHVVLDIKLPRRSGLEVLEWIRRRPETRPLPVAILTSSKDPTDLDRARRAGVDCFSVKPANISELKAILRGILKTWGLLA